MTCDNHMRKDIFSSGNANEGWLSTISNSIIKVVSLVKKEDTGILLLLYLFALVCERCKESTASLG